MVRCYNWTSSTTHLFFKCLCWVIHQLWVSAFQFSRHPIRYSGQHLMLYSRDMTQLLTLHYLCSALSVNVVILSLAPLMRLPLKPKARLLQWVSLRILLMLCSLRNSFHSMWAFGFWLVKLSWSDPCNIIHHMCWGRALSTWVSSNLRIINLYNIRWPRFCEIEEVTKAKWYIALYVISCQKIPWNI